MIRIGVSGAGAWGQNLLRNVASNEATELAAVCDPDGAARERVAAAVIGAARKPVATASA